MRNVYHLAAAVVLTVAALAFTAAPSESYECVYCIQERECTVCRDDCAGLCYYSCEPGGDGIC